MIEPVIESLIDLGLISADYRKYRKVKKQNKELEEKGIKKKYILYPSAKFGLIILGIVLPIWIGFLFFTTKDIKINMTMSEMNEISETLKNYKSENGDYPESLYIIIGNRPLRKTWTKDAWGIEYEYSAIENRKKYRLVSSGNDNTFQTKDDLIISK